MNRQVMDIRKACNPVKDKQLALKTIGYHMGQE